MASVPPPVPELKGSELLRVDLVWAAVMVGLVLLVFVLLESARGVGVPLFIALAISYLLGPIASWLESRGMGRTLSAGMLLLGGVGAFISLGFYLLPALGDEATKVPAFVTKAVQRGVPILDRYLNMHVAGSASKLTSEAIQKFSSMGDNLAPYLVKVLGSTASVLIALLTLLVVPVIAFHFLRLGPRVLSLARSLIPPRFQPHVAARFQEVDRVLGAFVRGQLTVGAILAAIYGIGFSAAGLDMALGIAFIGGFGNVVPYAGTGMCILLGSMSLLVSTIEPWQAGVALGTFAVAQIAEPLIITPRIVGERVGLHPVVIILCVLGFGELFGFVGVLLAVPTTAALTVVIKVLVARYRETPLYTGVAR